MSDQTIHNVTSLDWVVIDWIGENRTVSASALTWLEWHEELLELRAERDSLASELSRLRTLEAAAIHWNTHRCVHGVRRLEQAIEEAEKAREA